MNNIPYATQEREVNLTLDFLKKIGTATDNWIICYPYGAYNSSLIEILKKKNCKLALTSTSVNHDIANLNEDNAFSLARIDTNDLPREANAKINPWTEKVLN